PRRLRLRLVVAVLLLEHVVPLGPLLELELDLGGRLDAGVVETDVAANLVLVVLEASDLPRLPVDLLLQRGAGWSGRTARGVGPRGAARDRRHRVLNLALLGPHLGMIVVVPGPQRRQLALELGEPDGARVGGRDRKSVVERQRGAVGR